MLPTPNRTPSPEPLDNSVPRPLPKEPSSEDDPAGASTPTLGGHDVDGQHDVNDFATTNVPFSLWDYLVEEILANPLDGQELKSERIANFMNVPMHVERVRKS